MSNIVWTAEKGWHDGPEISTAEILELLTPDPWGQAAMRGTTK